jgi:hypothetical protein
MKAPSMTKAILNILTVFILSICIVPAVYAKKGGNGGGKPLPELTDCKDEFPGFAYMMEAGRRSPGEIWLSSTDGCRRELVTVLTVDGSWIGPFHMTADRSTGVLLWREDPGSVNQLVVIRQDFNVDASGKFNLELPVQLLPLDGEEEAPAGDLVSYYASDIWGDGAHDALYLLANRYHSPGPDHWDGTTEIRIYNLNDITMTDMREIYRSAQVAGEWSCPDVDYPQFVAGCYKHGEWNFNPSGTRLYITATMDDKFGQRWDAEIRILIDRIDADTKGVADLSDWTFSAPELVFTGTDGTVGHLARPANDPSQLPLLSEEIVLRKFADTGTILDADICAAVYEEYAGGNIAAAPDLWQDWCVVSSIFFSPNGHGGGDSWQSPDAILTSTYGKRQYDIYRRFLDGTEELLIENARNADTGY